MTAIAYHKGSLIADNVHLTLSTPAQKVIYPKIFVSKCKTFAYGFTGTTLNDTVRGEVEEFVRKGISTLIISKRDFVLTTDFCKEGLELNVENGLAITSHHAFYFREETKKMFRLVSTQGIGSGGDILTGVLLSGKSPETALKMVNMVDTMSGSTATIIKGSSLKPFILKGE